ncbi:MAG: DUF3530 family protein [Gammaproteobacteria bacterium]
MKPLVCVLLALLAASRVDASDSAREAAYADYIASTLREGRMVRLGSDAKRFIALYSEAETAEFVGTVVILHDKGEHPDQAPFIHRLRTVLPKHRFAALSLQMPLREAGAGDRDYYALFPEALARIEAAVDFLKNEDPGRVVLAGHGLGGLMALYAAERLPDTFDAVVAVALSVPNTDNPYAQTLTFIEKSNFPLLDIYGASDIPQVVESAAKRRLAAKDRTDYRQIEIAGADRSFSHDGSETVKRIFSWLRRIVDDKSRQRQEKKEETGTDG